MKKTMQRGLLIGMAMLALTAVADAGSQLSIRLIQASNRAAGGTPAPADIAGILKRSLPYQHFTLRGSATLSLPASDSRKLAGYSIACSGPQNKLRITVKSGKQSLVNTTVAMRDGKPFIVGGLPAKEGKEILVFVIR